MRTINETYWKTKNGNIIPISKMSDTHLDNVIQMLYRKAKKKAINKYKKSLSDEELIIFNRRLKLERILEEDSELDYLFIWEKFVEPFYWDLIYEKRIRKNILFR